ncbi:MAG: hypothetical protein ACJ789_04820 [Thermomicrobiales bacterium]
MEATPPQEPTPKEEPAPPAPPAPKRRRSPRAAAPVPAPAVSPDLEFADTGDDSEEEATRVYGALALGVMVILVICVIAFIIAFRRAPEGL